MKKNKDDFKIGDILHFQNEHMGTFLSGEVIKITNNFCILSSGHGYTKRKSKHLLYKTSDEAKLSVIKKIDALIQEQFAVNINELHKIYSEMIDKFPEKFV